MEALRARVLRDADNAAGRGVKLADMTFSVEGDTLDALCRAWLALDGAPEGRLDIWQNDCDEQGAVEIVMDADTVRHLIHRRVRIVPVDGGKAGQEVGNG